MLPPLFSKTPESTDKTAVRRRQLLEQFREAMKKGEMRVDVENQKDAGDRRSTNAPQTIGAAPGKGNEEKKVKAAKKEDEEDDFFQSGSDEE